MTFGAAPEPAPGWSGTLAAYDPPALVEYLFDHGGRMRFELERIDGDTRLSFTQFFPPGYEFPVPNEPGMPDSPWRARLLAGYYIALLSLGRFLDREFPTDVSEYEAVRRLDRELADEYRVLIKKTLPAE